MKHLIILGLVFLCAFMVWQVSIGLGIEKAIDSSLWWNILFLVTGIMLALNSGSNLFNLLMNS